MSLDSLSREERKELERQAAGLVKLREEFYEVGLSLSQVSISTIVKPEPELFFRSNSAGEQWSGTIWPHSSTLNLTTTPSPLRLASIFLEISKATGNKPGPLFPR